MYQNESIKNLLNLSKQDLPEESPKEFLTLKNLLLSNNQIIQNEFFPAHDINTEYLGKIDIK